MTCDDVFDRLTRGPFPSGAAGDELVERHLAHCADCRQLAMALAPALDLLREAIPAEEAFDLPGYRGPATWQVLAQDERHFDIESTEQSSADPWRIIRAEHPASTPAPVARRVRNRRTAVSTVRLAASVASTTKPRANLLRFAAAVLLGVAAAAGTRGWLAHQASPENSIDGVPAPMVAAMTADPNSQRQGADSDQLARLTLPAACRGGSDNASQSNKRSEWPGGIQLASAQSLGHQECCSDCHNRANPGLVPVARQAIVIGACRACH